LSQKISTYGNLAQTTLRFFEDKTCEKDYTTRQEEDGLTTEFLTALHERHEAWLGRGEFPIPAPVVVLDGNLDLAAFTKQVNAWVPHLLKMVAERAQQMDIVDRTDKTFAID